METTQATFDHLTRDKPVGEARKRLCVGLVVLTMLVMCPAINDPFMLDDFGHRVRVIDRERIPQQVKDSGFVASDSGTLWGSVRDMHSFVRNDEDLQRYMDYGLCPWWTNPDLRAANFRPLDSLSHWIDYRLWPDRPIPMHVHSLLWFLGVVVLLGLLYQRILSLWGFALVAGVLYVIDDSNYFPVMWVANRNLPHALFFSLCAILAHIRWRRGGSLVWGAVAPVFLLLSLLSTEAGIATMAYLVAYAVFLDKGVWWRRLGALIPAMVVIVVWRVVYNRLGFGASGGGFIIDPVRDPVAFLRAMCVRGPLLLSGLFGDHPAETYIIVSRGARTWFLVASAVFLVLLALAMWPLLKRDRIARFWCAAMLMCIVPICATQPMNRNLLFAAIAAFALLAMFMVGVVKKHSWLGAGRGRRVFSWIMFVWLFAIHVPLALGSRVISARLMPKVFEVFYSTIEVPEEVSAVGKTLVAVNAPNPYMFVGMPCIYAWRGEPLPECVRVIAPGFAPVEVWRDGPRSLTITSQQENLFTVRTKKQYYTPHFAYVFENFTCLFRDPDQPFEVGWVVRTPPMTAEVLRVDARSIAAAVRVTFDVDLDDESLVWLAWRWGPGGKGKYEVFEPPERDQVVFLDGPK